MYSFCSTLFVSANCISYSCDLWIHNQVSVMVPHPQQMYWAVNQAGQWEGSILLGMWPKQTNQGLPWDFMLSEEIISQAVKTTQAGASWHHCPLIHGQTQLLEKRETCEKKEKAEFSGDVRGRERIWWDHLIPGAPQPSGWGHWVSWAQQCPI